MMDGARARHGGITMNQLISNPDAVVKGDHYRITVLTPELFRLEYSEHGNFDDETPQIVVNR